MSYADTLARAEEALGAYLDTIRFRPEHAHKTEEELIRTCPEYAEAHRRWREALDRYIAHC